jgi:hypothetical protein
MIDSLMWWTGAAFWLISGMGTAVLLVVILTEHLLAPMPPRHWPHRHKDTAE